MTASAVNPRGREAVEISASFTVIATIVVLLRLYTRFFLVRCPGIEDYGIIASMICSIGLTICIGFQARYGMGQHIKNLEMDDMIKSLQAFWASLIVYYLSLGFTKISILVQYLRVFTTKRFQVVCWVIIAVILGFTIWTIFGSIFACIPVSAFWTRKPARCINQFAMWFTNAGFNIVTDFICIILPIPVIRSLNLTKRQKMALISIFAVGGFECVVSILRLQSLVAISNSTDPTYDNPPAATWSSVEINVGIICSCLPLLRPLLTRVLPGAFTSKRVTSTAPRTYATIGASCQSRLRKGTIDNNDDLELMRTSHRTNSDIRCVTDIHIHVEGDSKRSSEWGASVPKPDWAEKPLPPTTTASHDRASSTEMLVKEVGRVV